MLKDSRRCRKPKKTNFHRMHRATIRRLLAAGNYEDIPLQQSMIGHMKYERTYYEADRYERRLGRIGIQRLIESSNGIDIDAVYNKVRSAYGYHDLDAAIDYVEWATKPSRWRMELPADFPVVDGKLTVPPKVAKKRWSNKPHAKSFNFILAKDHTHGFIRLASGWYRAYLAKIETFEITTPFWHRVEGQVTYSLGYKNDAVGQHVGKHSVYRSKIKGVEGLYWNLYVEKKETMSKKDMKFIDEEIIKSCERGWVVSSI